MQYPIKRAALISSVCIHPNLAIQRLFSFCGLALPFIFWPGVFVIGILQPDYNPLADTISKMGRIGRPFAAEANALLVIAGTLLALSAQAIPRSRNSIGTSSRTWLALFGISGLAGAGLLPCDEYCAGMSTPNILHTIPVAIGFASLQLGLLQLSSKKQLQPYWRNIAATSLALFWAGSVALVAFVLGRWGVVPWLESIAGFSEKVFLAMVFAFIFVLAKRSFYYSKD